MSQTSQENRGQPCILYVVLAGVRPSKEADVCLGCYMWYQFLLHQAREQLFIMDVMPGCICVFMNIICSIDLVLKHQIICLGACCLNINIESFSLNRYIQLLIAAIISIVSQYQFPFTFLTHPRMLNIVFYSSLSFHTQSGFRFCGLCSVCA